MAESYEVTLKIAVTATPDAPECKSETERGRWVADGARLMQMYVDKYVGNQYRELGGGFEILSSTAHPTTVAV